MSLLSAKEIQEIIPHRYPFCFVDTVEELEPGKRIVAYKNVTINEPFFQGHFPGEPVMPGVLIVEALAQAEAILSLREEEFQGKIGYLGGLNKVKFRRMVKPGDRLRLEVEMLKFKRNVGLAKATAYVGDEIACECEMTSIIGDK